jgi:branched-chain amino acid transport system permease protein
VIWFDQIIQGTLLGGYYALIACGLSLMFGVMRIINLAHGDFAILSVFAVWLLVAQTGMSPFLALAAIIPPMALLGWALQHWVFERSLRAGPLVPLLATFGLAIVVENLLFEVFSADTRSLAPEIGDLAFSSWTLTDQIYVGHLAVLIFAVAVILLVGLQLLLKWTAIGRAIRATAEDPDTAELVGVNSRAAYAVAAAIAVATTAIAGTFLAMRATFDPYSGPAQLIFAFEAVVIGGIGSLWGTLVGGAILGIAQSLGAQIGPRGFLLTGHIVFLVVLGARLLLSTVGLRGALRRGLSGFTWSRSP